ncbi:hypothetical protein QTN25_004534 [Entamoeba marina]
MSCVDSQFKGDMENMKKGLKSIDEKGNKDNNIYSDLAHMGACNKSAKGLVNSFRSVEGLMQSLEMIICINGKKTLQQLSTSIKDIVNYYNAYNCIIASRMIDYIKTVMNKFNGYKHYDAFNMNLILSLQSVVRTLRPFTEKFTSSNGHIHKEIEKSLEPLDTTDLENNLVIYNQEKVILKEIKEKVKEYLQKDDIYSLTNALSYTSYIRMHYGYDKEAVELMEQVDQQCILSSNFGFIPNIHLFTKEVNPLLPQNPLFEMAMQPNAFYGPQSAFDELTKQHRKVSGMVDSIDTLGIRNVYNVAALVKNGYMAQVSHFSLQHNSSQSIYSTLYSNARMCVGQLEKSYNQLIDTNFIGKSCKARVELLFKEGFNGHYKCYTTNAIKPLYYRAYLTCHLSQCPKSVPGTYNEAYLPKSCYTHQSGKDNLDHYEFVSHFKETEKQSQNTKDGSCCLSHKYHLGVDSKSQEKANQVMDTIAEQIKEYEALLERQRQERVKNLYDQYIANCDDRVILNHNGEIFELLKTKSGYTATVSNTANKFLATASFVYEVNHAGYEFDFKYNCGEVERKQGKYCWRYDHPHGGSRINCIGHDLTPAYHFQTTSKAPEELVVLLSHAFKLLPEIEIMDKEVKRREKEQKKRDDLWKLKNGFSVY